MQFIWDGSLDIGGKREVEVTHIKSPCNKCEKTFRSKKKLTYHISYHSITNSNLMMGSLIRGTREKSNTNTNAHTNTNRNTIKNMTTSTSTNTNTYTKTNTNTNTEYRDGSLDTGKREVEVTR